MRVVTLNLIPDDPEISRAWNGLVAQMERPEIFFTYEWALAASRAFREFLRPMLFLLYDSDELSGVAALATNLQSPASVFFLTSTTADYCDVVSFPQKRKDVLGSLFEELKRLHIRKLTLANVPFDSCTFHELPSAAKPHDFHFSSRAAYDCRIIEFGDNQQREALLRSVSRKEREKRGLNKLRALGRIGLVHVVTPECGQQSLESIISSQVARFLASERESPLIRPERRAFLRELTDLLGRAGWLRISQLEVNSEPIAWNYGFRYGSGWFWYLPTYRVEREDASPGSCLLRLLVEEAAGDLTLRRLDLGLGDESYKERFGNNVQQTRYVELSQSLTRHVLGISRNVMTSVGAQHPRAKRILVEPRDKFRRLRDRGRKAGWIATSGYLFRKAIETVASKREVVFFEAGAIEPIRDSNIALLPLTWEHLARAAIRCAEDPDTLQYLMRSAARLKRGTNSGFVLQQQPEQTVHFLWVGRYDGFHLAEIDQTLTSDCSSAVLIFDCWTPAMDRGHGHYTTAIRLVAEKLTRQGCRPWIFAATNNVSSLRGIVKAGFQYRFHLVRRKGLGYSSKVTRLDSVLAAIATARSR